MNISSSANSINTATRNTIVSQSLLEMEGVGQFTSVEDSKVLTPDLPSVAYDYAHPIFIHLDVDAEYQTDSHGHITPCVVGWRDYVSGLKGLQDRFTDKRCIWDKVYGLKTVKLNRNQKSSLIKSQGVVEKATLTIVLYIFSTINDVRFSVDEDEWSKLLPDLLPISEQKRRIKIVRDKYGKPERLAGWYCIKDGVIRPLTIVIQDVSAFLGIGGLEVYASMVDVPVENKHLMDAYKSRMNEVWSGKYGAELKEQLALYAVGDLVNREIWLKANTEFAPLISKALKLPKQMVFAPTMGSTVSALFGALVTKEVMNNPTFSEDLLAKDCSFVGIGGQPRSMTKGSLSDKAGTLIEMVNAYGTSDLLKKEHHGNCSTSGRWLAKVDGGRAKNEIPELAHHEGCTADVDLGGAYASTMNNLCTYPIGRPSVLQMSEKTWEQCRQSFEFARKTKWTLRQILSTYEKEFVKGLFFMRVSKIQDKEIPIQTLIQSQILPTLDKMSAYESDCDDEIDLSVEKIDGSLTLLTGDLIHGTITFNELEILRRVCSQREWSSIIDGLFVEALVWYPKSERTEDIMDVLGSPNVEDGTDRLFNCGSVMNGVVNQGIYTIGTKWYGIPLSKMVAPLQSLRNVYPKKSPMNDLYKLFCNTTYGVLASVYFSVGNSCVASNITSTIRCGAWLMRTSLNTVQSITDGGACLINKVHNKPNNFSLKGLSLSNTYDENYLGDEFGRTHTYAYTSKEVPLLKDEDGNPVYAEVSWVSKDCLLWNRNNEHLTKQGKAQLKSGYWKLSGYQLVDGSLVGLEAGKKVKAPSTFTDSTGKQVTELVEYDGGLAELDRILYQHTRNFFDRGDGTTGITILDGYGLNVRPKSIDGSPVPNPKTSTLETLNEFATHHIDLSSFTEYNKTKGVITYESKGIFDGITTHGQCDYLLLPYALKSTNDDDIKANKPIIKWRGQTVKDNKQMFKPDGKTPYVSLLEVINTNLVDEDGDEIVIGVPSWVIQNPHPSKDLLFLLRSGLKLLPIPRLTSHRGWMKLNSYKKHCVSKLVKDGTKELVQLGDDQLLPVQLYYCSASQFMYKTFEQREAWLNYEKTVKAKTGFKLEIDYLVEINGVFMIPARDMISDLARRIQKGEMPQSLSRRRFDLLPKHPDFELGVGLSADDDESDV